MKAILRKLNSLSDDIKFNILIGVVVILAAVFFILPGIKKEHDAFDDVRELKVEDKFDLIYLTTRSIDPIVRGYIVIGDSVFISKDSRFCQASERKGFSKLGDLSAPYYLEKESNSSVVMIIKDDVVYELCPEFNQRVE